MEGGAQEVEVTELNMNYYSRFQYMMMTNLRGNERYSQLKKNERNIEGRYQKTEQLRAEGGEG